MIHVVTLPAPARQINEAIHVPYPQLTPEQSEALAANGGLPIHVEDPETHKLYVLAEFPESAALTEEYVRDELSKGLAAIDSGERVSWDPERIKLEGRRRSDATTISAAGCPA